MGADRKSNMGCGASSDPEEKANNNAAKEAAPAAQAAPAAKTEPAVGHSVDWSTGGKRMHLVVTGPPAGGKGSLCEAILHDYPGLVHLSTGDMLRAAVKAGSEAGKTADPLMKSGQLVPDEIVVECVRTALQTGKGVRKYGFILDGFPRSVGQANLLDKMLSEMEMSIDHVVALEVATEDLMARVLGRRIHKPSGRSYHLTFKPPKVEGKDDVTGEALECREDDTEETVKARIATFEAQTRPVMQHYSDRLLVVNGDNKSPPAAVAETALQKIKGGN